MTSPDSFSELSNGRAELYENARGLEVQ
jgi:hypothetical protein